MREEISGYDQSRTDPIPSLGDDPARAPEAPHSVPAQPAPAGPDFADTLPARPNGGPAPGRPEDTGAVLFGGSDVELFREQWRELQADFVDDPTHAVQRADRLVGEVMRALSETFAEHKHELEAQWQSGGAGETEELRVAMRRYRSFLDQLLNA